MTMKNGTTPQNKNPGNQVLKKTKFVVGLVVILAALVLLARWWSGTATGTQFIASYSGHSNLPQNAPTGIPAWLGWQHFLNAFFLILIIRSGWLIRTTTRPKAYWSRNNTGLFKTKGKAKKISLEIWVHLCFDVLWLANGVVFIAMLFATGAWMRIVPTSWDVFPNAFSSGIQYLSLEWPQENGWLYYNALQLLAYFVVVFIAAPLAAITGLRMSPVWNEKWAVANKILPIEAARKLHFPVMLFFASFILMHVLLVMLTGVRSNLNHMFAARSDDGWLGVILFSIAVFLTALAWLACRPIIVRSVAGLTGKISK
nr:cytochrome b/b6 domain-containing protein [Arthrobacter sp. MYb213]